MVDISLRLGRNVNKNERHELKDPVQGQAYIVRVSCNQTFLRETTQVTPLMSVKDVNIALYVLFLRKVVCIT